MDALEPRELLCRDLISLHCLELSAASPTLVCRDDSPRQTPLDEANQQQPPSKTAVSAASAPGDKVLPKNQAVPAASKSPTRTFAGSINRGHQVTSTKRKKVNGSWVEVIEVVPPQWQPTLKGSSWQKYVSPEFFTALSTNQVHCCHWVPGRNLTLSRSDTLFTIRIARPCERQRMGGP